jgi:AraC-like DNA-binding protein
MKIYIRNMVCNRCIFAVRSELNKLGLHPLDVSMGEVEFYEDISKEQLNLINKSLQLQGFELLDNKNGKLIEQIKKILIQEIYYPEENNKRLKFSVLLSQKLNKDYSALSNLFSELEGMTIEQYTILLKIERVKELLVYNELSLGQIADLMNYSSISHLSSQFKKMTGLAPSNFKALKENRRKSLDDVKTPK